MLIPLQRVREKESQIRGKAKVSPKAKTKVKVVGTLSTPKGLQVGNGLCGISSLGKRIQVKAKARKIKTKVKAKAIKVKVVEFQMLSPSTRLKSNSLQQPLLVINLNQKSLPCTLLKKQCRPSQRHAKSLASQSLIVVEVPDEQHHKHLPEER